MASKAGEKRPDEPKGELARYAFGFADKKPGWTYWAINIAMIVACAVKLWWFP